MIVSDTEFLVSIAERLGSAVDFREILDAVFRFVSGNLRISRMSLIAFDDPKDRWKVVAQQDAEGCDVRTAPSQGRITPELRSVAARFARSASVVGDYRATPDSAAIYQLGEGGMRSGVHVFMHSGGLLTGGFFVQHAEAGSYAERDGLFVYAVAQAVGPVLEEWNWASEDIEPKARRAPYATPAGSAADIADGSTCIVGSCDSMQRLDEEIKSVAPTEATALILGETGTGKELVARRIFVLSHRRDKPYIAVNCAALSPDLVASELFGHVAGAFTGATSAHKGRFELADGGTLFLDEVGDLPIQTQVKLLRTLESGEFQKVGGNKTLTTDVRVIAATHRDLKEMAAQGRFRADLFYRLNVFPIRLSPLRERGDDIRALAHHFVHLCAKKMDRSPPTINESAVEALQCYAWMGNVRELRNVMERAVILSNYGTIGCEHLPTALTVSDDSDAWTDAQLPAGHIRIAPSDATAKSPPTMARVDYETVMTLEDAVRVHILKALGASRGKVSGKGGAADLLGINPKTLESKMRKLGIQRRWA